MDFRLNSQQKDNTVGQQKMLSKIKMYSKIDSKMNSKIDSKMNNKLNSKKDNKKDSKMNNKI